jgi:hypothetical protein
VCGRGSGGYSDPAMPQLPPPDPHERTPGLATSDLQILAPTAVFTRGPVSPEVDRAADALLDLRPGLLIVLAA